MQMHYNIGQYFRKRYIEDGKFLSQEYNVAEVRGRDLRRLVHKLWLIIISLSLD